MATVARQQVGQPPHRGEVDPNSQTKGFAGWVGRSLVTLEIGRIPKIAPNHDRTLNSLLKTLKENVQNDVHWINLCCHLQCLVAVAVVLPKISKKVSLKFALPKLNIVLTIFGRTTTTANNYSKNKINHKLID